MGLDIRWPIGLMFSLIGVILVIYGFVGGSKAAMLERSLQINIDLIWGFVLLVFGGLMLLSAKIASSSKKQNDKQ